MPDLPDTQFRTIDVAAGFLPYPATKLIVTQYLESRQDPPCWAWISVGAFLDHEDRIIWSTELFVAILEAEFESDNDNDDDGTEEEVDESSTKRIPRLLISGKPCNHRLSISYRRRLIRATSFLHFPSPLTLILNPILTLNLILTLTLVLTLNPILNLNPSILHPSGILRDKVLCLAIGKQLSTNLHAAGFTPGNLLVNTRPKSHRRPPDGSCPEAGIR
ncbi:hypothetical protein CP532_5885 [Ophiocordyceps camponoti-leonardi (nom. inval.)]|nr:hypothetical protein CP532_5885 [Ophiocordyceps camponoti-leonardi (nom. inval.)]